MDLRLRAGQTIRYGDGIWQVKYVNECRARIVPLGKTQTVIDPEADRGVNISPNSLVEVVTDLETARTRLELEAAEAELRAAKREMRNRAEQELDLEEEVRRAEAELAELKGAMAIAPKVPEIRPRTGVVAARGSGWRLGPGPFPAFRAGSLAAKVLAYIGANAGQTTAQIVSGVQAEGAVAACVSRFNQAGLIERC